MRAYSPGFMWVLPNGRETWHASKSIGRYLDKLVTQKAATQLVLKRGDSFERALFSNSPCWVAQLPLRRHRLPVLALP
jgi:hypothetical protein